MVSIMTKCFITVFVVLILSSCYDKKEKQIDETMGEVFFKVIDSLEGKYDLSNKTIFIGRHENDEVIKFIKNDLRKEFGKDKDGPGILIMDLISIIGDSLYIDLSNQNKNYNIKWGNTNNKSTLTSRFNLPNNTDKCLLYVTDIVYTDNKKMGCFYISIGGVNNPAGYIVFIGNLDDDKGWRIISILKKWG